MQGKGPLKLQKGRLISLCGQIRAFETLHCIKYTVQGAPKRFTHQNIVSSDLIFSARGTKFYPVCAENVLYYIT